MEVKDYAASTKEEAPAQPRPNASAQPQNAAPQPKHAGALTAFISSSKSSVQRNYKIYALATLIYAVIAVLMFYQISGNMGSLVPGTGGDTYQNLWEIWWVGYATLLPSCWLHNP